MTDTMHLLNRRFLDSCRLHTINPGQTYIGTAHLHQEDWAELRLKAYASRVFTAFMAVCLQVVQRQHGNSGMDLNLITVATQQVSTWMLDVEVYPLDLTDEQSEHIYIYIYICYRVSVTWLCIYTCLMSLQVSADISTSCTTPRATEQPSISNEAGSPRNQAEMIMAPMMMLSETFFFD